MKKVPSDPARLMYAGTAFLFIVLSFIGFRHFYLHGNAYPGRPLTPPIRSVLIAHGLVMSLWMMMFVLQTLFVVKRQYRIHMFMGRIGAVLAGFVVYFGVSVSVSAARVNPPDFKLWGLVPEAFMAVSLSAIVLFAVFVGIAVWKRRRPEIHKPMMFLGTLAAVAPAIDRIAPVKSLYENSFAGGVFGPYFPVLVIGAGYLVLKTALTRTLERPAMTGFAVLAMAGALSMKLAATPVWSRVAGMLLR